MRNGRYLYYFDTCIFLHWLSDPKKDKGVVDGIEDAIAEAERNQAIIVTSVVTRVEILRSKLSADSAEKLTRAMRDAVIQQVNVDPPIVDVAHEIRDYHHKAAPPEKLTTVDCIHVASAIVLGCDEFLTLDGGGERRRRADLLPLSEKIAGGKYPLKITKPFRVPTTEPPPLFRLLGDGN